MDNERGALKRDTMEAQMGVEKVTETPPVVEKAIPEKGKSGQEETKVVTPPVEPPVTPPVDGEEPKPTDDKGESGEPDDDSEHGRKAKENTQKGVQKRIDKAVKTAKAAGRRADHAEGKVELLEKQLKDAKDVPLPELVVPKEEDFDDFDKYTDALVDHRIAVRDRDKAVKAKELEDVKTDPEPDAPQLTEEQEETREAMVDSLGEMREKYKDFDDVAFAKDAEGRHTFPVTVFMKEGMESSESRMEILYHLGQNPEEAAKIANLPPTKQVMAIARLDAKLKSPTKTTKKTPGAPTPIPPVGGLGVSTTDMNKLGTDDWMEKRNADTGTGRRR